jgi:hypothetical protein
VGALPTSEPTDPEISGLFRHLRHTLNAESAWCALQFDRTEALAGARDGAARQAKTFK